MVKKSHTNLDDIVKDSENPPEEVAPVREEKKKVKTIKLEDWIPIFEETEKVGVLSFVHRTLETGEEVLRFVTSDGRKMQLKEDGTYERINTMPLDNMMVQFKKPKE